MSNEVNMNPFKYGQIVSGENFCSRPRLEKILYNHIDRNQNILVEGERRTGKSSLVYRVSGKFRGRPLVLIDLFQIKSDFDLQKRILNAIRASKFEGLLEKIISAVAHLRPQFGIDPLNSLPTLTVTAGEKVLPESIEGLLSLLADESLKRNIIVVFDEFQDIMNLPDYRQTIAVMRGKIQYHDRIAYVFSGSVRKKLEMIFDHPDSPFFKAAAKIAVGPIEDDLFASFISDKFKEGGREVCGRLISEIFQTAKNVPGDIQELCSAIWDITNDGDKMTPEILPLALNEIFAVERACYETHIQFLTDIQLRCLAGIARLGGKGIFSSGFLKNTGIGSAASVKKSVNRLLEVGLVYFHDGEYKFSNPFFRLWLLKENL